MIIVEGPDGSGKTTLIKNLGLVPLRFRALRGGQGGTRSDGSCGETAEGWAAYDPAPVAYAREVFKYALDPRIAFDRFHLSEMVYGPLLRGRSGISLDEAGLLQMLLKGLQVPIIICLPPLDVTMSNVATAGRERPAFQTEEFLLTAYILWQRLSHLSLDKDNYPNLIVYDYTRNVGAPPPIRTHLLQRFHEAR